MCGETRIPRDMCAGNTLPGETYITVTPAFLAARHTTVCLDLIKNSQAVKEGAAPKKVNDFKTLLDRHYSNCLFYFV